MIKMSPAKTRIKPPSKAIHKRDYDNSSRALKAEQTQKHIIETYINLLAKKQGGEIPIDELAQTAGISQRTVFRFFNDKEALHQATDKYLQQYVHASLQKLQSTDILEFTRDSFKLFEKYENLVIAYMFSPYGAQTRLIFRKKLNKY